MRKMMANIWDGLMIVVMRKEGAKRELVYWSTCRCGARPHQQSARSTATLLG